MSSKVQICNMAISLIGGNTIVSLVDNTTEAILCNTLFDDLADRAMIQGSWSTTLVRTALAKTTNTPAFEFTNEFQLPVDPFCLKVLNIDGDPNGDIDYAIEGNKLLTDESSIKIRYISRLVDTEDYGVALTEAVQFQLASFLAIPVAGDKALAKDLGATYQEKVDINLAIDGQQGSLQELQNNDMTRVR